MKERKQGGQENGKHQEAVRQRDDDHQELG
jgi:hypothetical protein